MTAAIDIMPEQRKTLLAFLHRFIPGVAVWAYGSRVKWTARPNSDLDLVAFITPVQRHLVSELKDALAESDLPFLVDFHVWDEVPERFHEIIRKEYVVLQESKQLENGLGKTGKTRTTIYGDIAIGFTEDRLANLCVPDGGVQTGPFGSQLHQEDYVEVGTPIITVEHLGDNRIRHEGLPRVSDQDKNRLAKYALRGGDIVFSRVGSVDRRALVRDAENGWLFSGRCLRVRPEPTKIDSEYLSYFFGLPSFKEHIRAIAVGATMPSLNTQLLSDIIVPHPRSVQVQRAIAHILGTLDDKIELNRRMNATLEAMARALFQSWFVDFDPVRAKLDGRKPAGLDAATAALFPAHFQESTLGELPQGWRIGTLGELVELRTDRVDPTPSKDDKRYVALEDMPSKSIDLSNHQLGSAVNSSITAFRKDDVLFGSMRPYFHKVGLAFFDGITRTTTFVLRPRKDYFRHFALMHFFSDDVVAHATIASVGTTIPYVKWDSLENYKIPIPPDTLLDAFEKAVSPFIQRIAAQGEESRTLATLRDALLPKLLSGELQVQNNLSDSHQLRH